MNDTSESSASGDASSIADRDAAGWFLDQTGRFELRYWDGSGWTEHVRIGLREQTDPLVGGAVHVRLGALDPNDRLLDDIAVILGEGRRVDPQVSGRGPADAPPRPVAHISQPPQGDAQASLTTEHWRAQSLAHRAYVGAIIWVVVALTPVVGSVGVLGGSMTLGLALRARRLCTRVAIGTNRAVDAALLSVLVIATSIANLLVTVELSNQGVIYDTVMCGFEGAIMQCLGNLLRSAGSIVSRTVIGG